MTNNPTRRGRLNGMRSVIRRRREHPAEDGPPRVAPARAINDRSVRRLRRGHPPDGDTPDGPRPRFHNGQTLRDRSRRWAVGLALLVALVSSPPIVFGLDWSVISLVFVFLVLGATLSLANRWTADWMGRNARPVSLRRLALAITLAVPVAGGATLWLFDQRVDDFRTEQDPMNWTSETDRLTEERRGEQDILDRPVPVVFDDPEVQRLRSDLTAAGKELSDAEKALLCEQDGTCGTGVEGEADAYYSKEEYRDSCKDKVAKLNVDLELEKDRVTDEAERLTGRQSLARGRVQGIDGRLDRLGRTPPIQPSRPVALVAVADRDTVRVGGMFILVFFVFIASDWGLLTAVERRILRRRVDKGGSIVDKVRKQAEYSAKEVIDHEEWSNDNGAEGPSKRAEHP